MAITLHGFFWIALDLMTHSTAPCAVTMPGLQDVCYSIGQVRGAIGLPIPVPAVAGGGSLFG